MDACEMSKTENTKATLTEREKEVLQWLKVGRSTRDISKILNISERTVKFHVGNIVRRLNAENRTHAVAVAMGKGLLMETVQESKPGESSKPGRKKSEKMESIKKEKML